MDSGSGVGRTPQGLNLHRKEVRKMTQKRKVMRCDGGCESEALWYVTPKSTNGLRKRRLALCLACVGGVVQREGLDGLKAESMKARQTWR